MKNDLSNMMCLDIYLSNLTSSEYQEIKDDIDNSNLKTLPLISWDVYMEHLHKNLLEPKKSNDLTQIASLSKKFKWKNDITKLLNENKYDALIITDMTQKIVWLNDGFTKMTGYSEKFALNKTPRFLQGEKTSKKVKKNIREKIKVGIPFKETIINYKKDKTMYKCEVKIIPLYAEKTTHFLALEREVV